MCYFEYLLPGTTNKNTSNLKFWGVKILAFLIQCFVLHVIFTVACGLWPNPPLELFVENKHREKEGKEEEEEEEVVHRTCSKSCFLHLLKLWHLMKSKSITL